MRYGRRGEDGKIAKIRPKFDNSHSRRHICVKVPALADVVYDDDRVTRPLKRSGEPGEFVPLSWDEALSDVAARLGASMEQHGSASFAMSTGNPPSMGWSSAMANALFQLAMGCRKIYTPSSQDITRRQGRAVIGQAEAKPAWHHDRRFKRGIADDSQVQMSTSWGSIEVTAKLTEDVRPGCVAYARGRGQAGGGRCANERFDANLDYIKPSTPQMDKQVSGMSYLEGFDVEIHPVAEV